jgi:hypothetical protein
MIIKIALGVLFIAWFIWAFLRGIKRVQLAKAQCRASMNKWLLEKADECDLKAEDDTKTWPPGGAK